MKRTRRRKCLHCGELFKPDARNRRHQRYCSTSACRKASKAASQRRWLAKPANREYFRGPAHVARVQAWRDAHPGYARRQGRVALAALQADCMTQPIDETDKTANLTVAALQDLLAAQPYVLIGLIANLTGSPLQDDIARTGQRLEQLGRDILTPGDRPHEPCDSAPRAPTPTP